MPQQPEFVVDRNLGKTVPRRLRESGWIIHLIADLYPDDAQTVQDEDWLADAYKRGWVPLCKDGRIVGRAHERQPIMEHQGVFFFLNNQTLSIDEMVQAIEGARAAIWRAALKPGPDAYAITRQGRLDRRWPPPNLDAQLRS